MGDERRQREQVWSTNSRLVNNLKSDEDLELQKKKITTDNIIHVSSVEFHEELNGTTPGAVKVGPKKRTQKNCKIQPKMG